ncbi:hypothetical protein HJG60_011270 [Phyllostomus discolor]|uniref:Uncharacterized protein n=1 Tax=Phyllostomus discolor TaxID=89673 RepID=A0A833ZWH9_9CHIR|nr:hypothetical protein HJG60_011270 [Phyllostomus discolor]
MGVSCQSCVGKSTPHFHPTLCPRKLIFVDCLTGSLCFLVSSRVQPVRDTGRRLGTGEERSEGIYSPNSILVWLLIKQSVFSCQRPQLLSPQPPSLGSHNYALLPGLAASCPGRVMAPSCCQHRHFTFL